MSLAQCFTNDAPALKQKSLLISHLCVPIIDIRKLSARLLYSRNYERNSLKKWLFSTRRPPFYALSIRRQHIAHERSVMNNTYNIVVTEKLGELVPEPSSVKVTTGDTVVWNYEGSKKFYVRFTFGRYESQGENGHQSLVLPVVEKFSSPARYDIGQV